MRCIQLPSVLIMRSGIHAGSVTSLCVIARVRCGRCVLTQRICIPSQQDVLLDKRIPCLTSNIIPAQPLLDISYACQLKGLFGHSLSLVSRPRYATDSFGRVGYSNMVWHTLSSRVLVP